VKLVKDFWFYTLKILSKETLLYIPTSRGGSAAEIVKCRCLQQVILRLLEYAPRLGLITETGQLLETIQTMEQAKTLQPGAPAIISDTEQSGTKGGNPGDYESVGNPTFADGILNQKSGSGDESNDGNPTEEMATDPKFPRL
jgi:hypothetical protein